MSSDRTAQSKPVLLFLQQGLANFKRMAHAVRRAQRSGQPATHYAADKLSSAVDTLKSKVRMQKHTASAPGRDDCGDTQLLSDGESVASDTTPRLSHSTRLRDARAAHGSFVPSRQAMQQMLLEAAEADTQHAAPGARGSAAAADGEGGAASPTRRAVLAVPPGDDAAVAAHACAEIDPAAEDLRHQHHATTAEHADLVLFTIIGRIAKALYPSKKTWVSTAYHVSTWLGLPRMTREGLHTWLRQNLASEAALARHVHFLSVRSSLLLR